MLGLSVLATSASVATISAPVEVEAATVVKPIINLKTTSTITVGRGSTLDVYKNVVKSVTKGTYAIKTVTLKSVVNATTGKKITLKNSPITTTGKVPAKTLKFPAKQGTYKLQVIATDNKSNRQL